MVMGYCPATTAVVNDPEPPKKANDSIKAITVMRINEVFALYHVGSGSIASYETAIDWLFANLLIPPKYVLYNRDCA
jgi:hypothetical protein